MARRITLGLIVPDVTDPTSYYRGIGPLAMLKKQMVDLDFAFINPPFNWASFKLCDMVFMQRPALPDHFNALLMCRDEGIPIWVDFDDDNLSVPKDNPTYNLYSQPPIKDSIVKLIRYADVVTVSTERLRKKYCIYNKNVFLVPNALDDYLLRLRALPTTPREKMLLWRGTPTHTKNLKVIQEQVIELAQRNSSWKFGFFGYEPLDITDRIKNYQSWPAVQIKDFFKMMCNIHPTAVYYSLSTANDHSMSRSHVSWLEATFGNALFIGPDMDEFKRPGTLNFKTPEEFQNICQSVINGEVDIDKHIEQSWKHIQENYMLSKVNNLRAQIIKQLYERVYGPIAEPVAS